MLYVACIMHILTASLPCSNFQSWSNYYYLWSKLDKLQAVPLICMASMIQNDHNNIILHLDGAT